MSKINITEILDKHCKENHIEIYGNQLKAIKAAMHEAIEAVIDKCAEEANMTVYKHAGYNSATQEKADSFTYHENHGSRYDVSGEVRINQDSILNVKTQIDYD